MGPQKGPQTVQLWAKWLARMLVSQSDQRLDWLKVQRLAQMWARPKA